jgi:putative nucleotidyltransferase with HDIG domain
MQPLSTRGRSEQFVPLTGFAAAGELVGAVQRLSLARSLEDIQSVVRSAARRLTGADGATFVLRDVGYCFYADEDAIEPLWKGQRFPLDACVSGWAMTHREAAIIPDIYTDSRVPHEAYRPTFVKSMCMVPIRTSDPVGAIGNYWAVPHDVSQTEVQLLRALADSTAVAMENVRMMHELEDARLETLQRLARAAEYRDDDTFAHTERVAATTARIADAMGLAPDAVEVLRQAAPLHDIGKIAIPDAILMKAAPLTPAEREHMKLHVERGAAILVDSKSTVLRTAREIVLSHHEWWNGSGYPAGVAGDAIPLSGRIVALADVFDALTNERPYKPAWSISRATDEINRLAAMQFDPAVVRAFHSTL